MDRGFNLFNAPTAWPAWKGVGLTPQNSITQARWNTYGEMQLSQRMRSLHAILRTSLQNDIFGLLPEKACRVSTNS